jgi:hypothetical protein
MYAQMLCGLCHRHAVLCIGAAFAYGLVRAVSFLQRNWGHLADDIEAGALIGQYMTDWSCRLSSYRQVGLSASERPTGCYMSNFYITASRFAINY